MLNTVPNGSQIANIVIEQYYGRKGFSRNRKIRLVAGLRRPELFALDFLVSFVVPWKQRFTPWKYSCRKLHV